MVIRLIVSAFSVMVAAYLLPGVHVDGYFAAFVVAVVLGILNLVVKPVLHFFALPITLVTLGFFSLVINAVVVLLTDYFVAGFSVDGFWWALGFSVLLSLVSSFLGSLARD
jgi:putative membrane protein